MKSNVIDLTPRIKDGLYDYLAGVGFRRKRGALTLREKLERKAKLMKRQKAKVLPFRKARPPIDNTLSLEVIP
ncbi:MAG: hypothetical protein EOP04_00995 [Proteobacteria bacterium]|nr:MAG: hypothetical protein EOP04_00995 [Pseudomonadota bacterium]